MKVRVSQEEIDRLREVATASNMSVAQVVRFGISASVGAVSETVAAATLSPEMKRRIKEAVKATEH